MSEIRLISVYNPPGLSERILIISTSVIFDENEGIFAENETAIVTVDEFDNKYALNKVDFDAWDIWSVIKRHKTREDAYNFHLDMTRKLSRDNTYHYEIYHKLLKFEGSE